VEKRGKLRLGSLFGVDLVEAALVACATGAVAMRGFARAAGKEQASTPEVAVLGIGNAYAPHASRQMDLLPALAPALEPGSPREALARRLFRNACIDERRFCIPDFGGAGRAVLYGGPPPGLRRRMDLYRSEAPRLAASACERAMKSARVAADEISHLVVVTCTGIFTPGPDVELVSRLALRPEVERTVVAFMGCSGAFHGLRVARRAALEPGARVLLVCVELCSLHRREETDAGSLVAQSLFADGAAALVLGPAETGTAPLLVLGQAATHLEPDTRDALTWEMRDDGFSVHLSPELPALVGRGVARFVAPLLEGLDPELRLAWLVHPGGAAILRSVERALGLGRRDLASAWSVLRRLGNTSSAAILYVLAEALPDLAPGAEGLMLGFGPGLTFEAVRFRRGAGRA
jgi:predicted naringenin-chalcone synthase